MLVKAYQEEEDDVAPENTVDLPKALKNLPEKAKN